MPEKTGRWVSGRDLRPDARLRLFCLPHAGSGAAGFYRWKAVLRGRGIDVCPVLLPGRESRLGEWPIDSVDEVVGGLMQESEGLLERPYAIFGHSMGALLAFGWARAIAREACPKPACLFVSGRDAPQTASGPRLHALGDKQFLEAVDRRYGGDSAGLLNDPELRAIFLPILRADLALVEDFRYVAGPKVDFPVVALAGEEDASVTSAGLAGWGELTRREFHCERLPGGHFYHLAEGQAKLLALIGDRLAPAM